MVNPPPTRPGRFCALPHTRSGFTLIEILVALAIIAVLAVLLTPVITSALNSSRGAKSLSNLKQIGQATLTWAGERNGRFPLTSSGGQDYWFRVLEEDVLGWKRSQRGNTVPPLFRCPVRNVKPLSERQPTPDYAANTWVLTQANGPRPSPNHPWPAVGRALSTLSVRQPSKTIMFTTGSYWLVGSGFPNGVGKETDIYTGLQNGKAFGAVFCDGHVEVIPRAKIFDDPDAMANRRALFDPFHEAP